MLFKKQIKKVFSTDFVEDFVGEQNKLMFVPMFLCNIVFWSIALIAIFSIPLKNKKKENEKKIKLKNMMVSFCLEMLSYK